MLKAPCVCHWHDPSVRLWVGISDPQSSLKGATYSRVSVGQGPLFNVKWECLFAHQRGVLSCRSQKHSASPMLLPRLWSLNPTSPIHPTLLPSKLGSCLCQPHQALYLLAPSTSPRPEQRAGNTSPPVALAAQDQLCGHLCPESFSLSTPLMYCFCLGFPVFGSWSPPLICSQDTRLPLAHPCPPTLDHLPQQHRP